MDGETSFVPTSIPAPARCPDSSAATIASSSTSSPLAALTKYDPRFIWPKVSAFIMWWESSSRVVWMETTSAAASSSSRVSQRRACRAPHADTHQPTAGPPSPFFPPSKPPEPRSTTRIECRAGRTHDLAMVDERRVIEDDIHPEREVALAGERLPDAPEADDSQDLGVALARVVGGGGGGSVEPEGGKLVRVAGLGGEQRVAHVPRAAHEQEEGDVRCGLGDRARAARDDDVAPRALVDVDGVVAHGEGADEGALGACGAGTSQHSALSWNGRAGGRGGAA